MGGDVIRVVSGSEGLGHLRYDVNTKKVLERIRLEAQHLLHPVKVATTKIQDRRHVVGVQDLMTSHL